MKNMVPVLCITLMSAFSINAQMNLSVCIDQTGAAIQPTMWGVFFEDINFAADGGLYAELVKNRSFEFYKPLMGWKIAKKDAPGEIRILNRKGENPVNPRYARIISRSDTGGFGIVNEGFRGMGVKQGVKYHFSVIARTNDGANIKMVVELTDNSGNVIGSTTIEGFTNIWNTYRGSFVSSATDPHARLKVHITGNGTIDMDMISLFPEDTWKKRPNGLRADLVQMLAELDPGLFSVIWFGILRVFSAGRRSRSRSYARSLNVLKLPYK